MVKMILFCKGIAMLILKAFVEFLFMNNTGSMSVNRIFLLFFF